MNTFAKIEKVMSFHHTTTTAPMNLNTMLKTAQITRGDLDQTLRVWPAAYKITRLRLCEFIECCEKPYDVVKRAAYFEEKLKSGVLGDITNTAASAKTSTPKVAVAPSKIIKSSPKKAPVLNMEQLLKLVAQKNAANKLAQEQLSSKRKAFYQSHVPTVMSILQTLAKQSRSFSTIEVVRKVQGSLKSALSSDEVMQVLGLIAEQMPTFCRIVDAGRVKCIHLMVEAARVAV